MNEPSLSIHGQKFESAYRFLWLRTFKHPISVRIEKCNDLITLNTVELDGAGGYQPGKIITDLNQKLPMSIYQKICTLLADIDFWDIDTTEPISGLDGSQWILEGYSNRKYHVVVRFSPQPGKYREICLFFLELSGLRINPDEIY